MADLSAESVVYSALKNCHVNDVKFVVQYPKLVAICDYKVNATQLST